MNETLPELDKNELVPEVTWAAMVELRARALSDNGRKIVNLDILRKSMEPLQQAAGWLIEPTVDVLLPEAEGGSPVKMDLVAVGFDGAPIDPNSRVSLGDMLKKLSPEQPFSNPTIPSDSSIGFGDAVAIAQEEIYKSFERAKEVLEIVGLELDDLRWPVFS